MNWEQDPNGGKILATCLSTLYDHHLMLASLDVSGSEVAAGADSGMSSSGSIATAQPFAELAAQRVSTLASSIVMKSQALQVPHETYHAAFIAGVVSYTSMRSSQTMLAQVGRRVVDNCRMVLYNVREAWDGAPWIIALFDGLTSSLNDMPNRDLGEQGALMAGRTPGFTFGSIVDIDETIMGYGIGASWQSNPMLSALFDTSQPMDAF